MLAPVKAFLKMVQKVVVFTACFILAFGSSYSTVPNANATIAAVARSRAASFGPTMVDVVLLAVAVLRILRSNALCAAETANVGRRYYKR